MTTRLSEQPSPVAFVLVVGLAGILAVVAPAERAWAQHDHGATGDDEVGASAPPPDSEDSGDLWTAIKNWWSPSVERELTVEEKYDDGLNLLYDHEYPEAVTAFERILDENPYSPIAVQAELKVAESYYYQGKVVEALPLLEKFAKAHPANAERSYATYLIGMCHFKQMDLIDRDQTETESAVTNFRLLLDQFPESLYGPLAAQRLAECRERLAESELYIGRFYFKQDDYSAAAGRFQTVLDAYPESKAHDEALYLLALSLKDQKKWVEAEAKLEELLDTRPEGEYTAKAKTALLDVRKEAEQAAREAEASPPAGQGGKEKGKSWFPGL